MFSGLIAIAIIMCAVQAIRAARLLSSAVWLAGASALTALWLYILGAQQPAVIELSVGAGLVTVLFIFAISISGEEAFTAYPRVPRKLALLLVVGAVALLAVDLAVASGMPRAVDERAVSTLSDTFWNARALDMLVQMVLIFAGVLGVLNLIGHEEIKEVETPGEIQIAQTHLPQVVEPENEELLRV